MGIKQSSFRRYPNFTNIIVQLKKAGKTNDEIANFFREHGYTASRSGIQRVAVEAGVPGKLAPFRWSDTRVAAYERKRGYKTLKGLEKRMLIDFSVEELSDLLSQLRSDGLSYQEIADRLCEMGYRATRKPVERMYESFGIAITRDRSGERNSFYGKSHTDDTKARLSSAAAARVKGTGNPMYGKRGELSPTWAGGKSRKAALFYASSEWADKRFEIMALDGFRCLQCGFTPKKKHGGLNVHHIIPLSVDWDARLDNDNLLTLCVDCHKATFGIETELIPLYQDIVRTARRRAEAGRNDLSG